MSQLHAIRMLRSLERELTLGYGDQQRHTRRTLRVLRRALRTLAPAKPVNAVQWSSQGFGRYRLLAEGWWADVEYRYECDSDAWLISILGSNAVGRISDTHIALTANAVIGNGEVPPEQLLWADTRMTVL